VPNASKLSHSSFGGTWQHCTLHECCKTFRLGFLLAAAADEVAVYAFTGFGNCCGHQAQYDFEQL
jgi:hypothetical protein